MTNELVIAVTDRVAVRPAKSQLVVLNTSRYPDTEVRVLVEFALSTIVAHDRFVGAGKTLVARIQNTTRSYGGHCCPWKHNILVRIGAPDKFPRNIIENRFKDMPEPFQVRTYRECLIWVAAHEWAHLIRKNSEEFCDLAGDDAVNEYRQRQVEIDGRIETLLTREREREVHQERRVAAISELKSSPQYRLERQLRAEKRWLRKSRLASTKLKGIRRSISALRRSITKQVNQQPQ